VTKAAFRVNFEELAGSQEVDFSAVLRQMEEAAGIAGGSPALIARYQQICGCSTHT